MFTLSQCELVKQLVITAVVPYSVHSVYVGIVEQPDSSQSIRNYVDAKVVHNCSQFVL